MFTSFLDSSSFIVLYPLLLACSVFVGIHFGIQYTKKKYWVSTGTEAAIIGIFGLIISFTFLTSGNAHRERYTFIHQEAAGSEMLFRYSKEIPGRFSIETKNFLLQFLDNHSSYSKKGPDNDKIVGPKAVLLMDNYWAFKTEFAKKNTDPVTTRKLEQLSTYFDLIASSFSRIVYSYDERTPVAVMYLLIVGSLMIGFLVGFMNGVQNTVHYFLPVVYVIFITLVMLVIRDLNNPHAGLITPGYEDLRIMRDYINTH